MLKFRCVFVNDYVCIPVPTVYVIIFITLYLYIDEFIVDTVVNTNDVVSDPDASDSVAHARPFGESSYSAVMSKGTTIGMHNAYIAMGTFASAIFIVAIVVSFNATLSIHCYFSYCLSFKSFFTLPSFHRYPPNSPKGIQGNISTSVT